MRKVMRQFLMLVFTMLTLAFGANGDGVTEAADFAASGPCDWTEGQAHKMHWAQLPDMSSAGLDVLMAQTSLADDFRCSATGPITGIHIWGSFSSDVLPDEGPESLTLEVSVYADMADHGSLSAYTRAPGVLSSTPALVSAAAAETIEVRPGEEFVVSLSYLIIPYSWELADPLPDWLHLIGTEIIPAPSGCIGCPGMEEWTFQANGEGDAIITFEYRSIADPSEPPAQSKSYQIIARAEADGHGPGALLWTQTFGPGQYTVRLVQQGPSYDPATGVYRPGSDRPAHQYNFCIDEPLVQTEGTIYWLAVKEIARDDATYKFGWKATVPLLHWNESAVYQDATAGQWRPMVYPQGHPHQSQPLGLAFVITGAEEGAESIGYDWGDAPDALAVPGYPTLSAHGGANHLIAGPWLGDADDRPDTEPDGQPDPNAIGDDNDGRADEGGVSIPPLVRGQPASITLEVSGGGGVIQGWIDFDADGTWHAAEEVCNQFVADGTHRIEVSVPESATAGPTYARFRISTQGGLGPQGPAADGEVEDYEVWIDTLPPRTKWCQWPDLTPNGVSIRVDNNDRQVRALADDWLCDTYNQITGLHFWGSWKDDQKGIIKRIRLRFHGDDPAGPQGSDRDNPFSKPREEILWQKDFGLGRFEETPYHAMRDGGQWWDPVTETLAPAGATQLWRIDLPIDIRKAFVQQGWTQSPRTYWLAIQIDTVDGEFGWRTRQGPDHYADDPVWDVGEKLPRPWKELPYPQEGLVSGPDKGSTDMAFYFTYSRSRTPTEQRDDLLNLYEAVFLWFIDGWVMQPAYFLLIGESDPSETFLDDFPYYHVYPGSEWEQGECEPDPPWNVITPSNGPLLHIKTDSLTWLDPDTVEIQAGATVGPRPLDYMFCTLRLRWQGTAWEVIWAACVM